MQECCITTILTQYKRRHRHAMQVGSILAQTVPSKIVCWCNGYPGSTHVSLPDTVSYVECTDNWKFHARFALGLCVKTPYVAIFDDDTIPGPKWFESCLKYADAGILGASGVILTGEAYKPHKKVGHNGFKNIELTEVDLVGHAWFMRKEFLRYLFLEEPYSWDNGEDIQLSAVAKMHGIRTFVPPHAPYDEDSWGCQAKYLHLGIDNVATSINTSKEHYSLRDDIVRYYKARGWDTVVGNKNDNS